MVLKSWVQRKNRLKIDDCLVRFLFYVSVAVKCRGEGQTFLVLLVS